MILSWDGSYSNGLEIINLICSIVNNCVVEFERDARVIIINGIVIRPHDMITIKRNANICYIEHVLPQEEK
jgi:hypothetical protein